MNSSVARPAGGTLSATAEVKLGEIQQRKIFQPNTEPTAQGWRRSFVAVDAHSDLRNVCSHDDRTTLGKFVNKAGVLMFRHICLHCSANLSEHLKHASLSDEEKRSALEYKTNAEYKRAVERRIEWLDQKNEERRASWRRLYERYLLSIAWQEKRRLVLERDDYVCRNVECDLPAKQVHHLTYTRVGDEHLEDLVSVCEYCHRAVHGFSVPT